jgi:arsenate reductase
VGCDDGRLPPAFDDHHEPEDFGARADGCCGFVCVGGIDDGGFRTAASPLSGSVAACSPFPLVDEARPAHHTTRFTLLGSMKIVIYQKPTCTTCRQVHAALVESGVDFDAVDYYVDPIPKKKLLDLLRKMRLPPRALLRTKEPVYKTLRLAERDLTDDEIVDLMVKNPDLIQRPIVEKGARAILARPAERLKEIL